MPIFNADDIKNILINKNINRIFHANTVRTACTFLENEGLLSRGAVEQRSLPQTPQNSDDIDKKYGIWFDIFLDSCDIHDRVRDINYYGPVLFVFKTELLGRSDIPQVSITKKNPQYWNDSMRLDDKYFISVEEIEDDFKYAEFGQMLTIRNTNETLYFSTDLEKIILDNPKRNIAGEDAYSIAYNALKKSMEKKELNLHIEERKCINCGCLTTYEDMYDRNIKKYFMP